MNKKYKRVKKAANGLQDVAVPEQGDDNNVLSSATTFASAGSQFGLLGGIAGGVLGLGAGLLQKGEQDRANKAALEKNKLMKSNRGISGVDESIDQKPQRFKNGGKPNTKVIEIEGKKTPEIHTDKNFNVKNLGTTPHTKGGNKVVASEGDIVFNTQNSLAKYNKIASAIQSGDKSTLVKEKNRLPDDTSDKAQDGKKSVKAKRPNTPYGYRNDGLPNINLPVVKTQGNTNKTTSNIPSKKVSTKPVSNTVTPFKRESSISTLHKTREQADLDNKTMPKVNLPTYGNKFGSNSVGSQGKKISGKTSPIIPTPPPLVPGVKSGNFALEGQNRVTTPMAATAPNTPVTNTTTPTITNPATVETIKEGVTNNTIPKSNTANNIASFTGVANNLFQGLKSEKPISEKYFDPQLNTYTDRSQSLRNDSTSAMNIQNSNARNVSGGNAANLRANQNQAALSNLGRQNSIDEQEMSRRDAIEASNTGLKNAAGQYNLQRKDMYQSQIDGTRAAKQSYIDQAAADIGQYGMAKQEENYLRSKDDKANASQLAGLKAINGNTQFKFDTEGNRTFEGDSESSITRFGLPGYTKKTRSKVGYAKGTKSVNTKYKMK